MKKVLLLRSLRQLAISPALLGLAIMIADATSGQAQFPSVNAVQLQGHVVVVERATIQGVNSWSQTVDTDEGPIRTVCSGAAVADCSTLVFTPYGLIPAVLYHGNCVPLYESSTSTSHLWACKPGGWGHCRATEGYLKGSPVSGFITPVIETSTSC